MVTPSGRSISLTPIVFRSRVRRTGFTGVRMTPPLLVMANSSSSGLITNAPTSPPRRSVIFAVNTPLPPRPCTGILLDRRPLRIPAVGRDQNVHALTNHLHREEFVTVAEAHADHTGGRPTHRPQGLVGRVEPDRLGLLRHQQQVVLRSGQRGAHQLVILPQVDGDDATAAVGVKFLEPGLLHQTILGGEHKVGLDLVIRDLDDLRDVLVRLEREQVRDVLALGHPAALPAARTPWPGRPAPCS